MVLEPFVPPSVAKKGGEAATLEIPKSLSHLESDGVFGLGGAPPEDIPVPDSDDDELLWEGGRGSEERDEPDEARSDDLDGDCYFPKDGYDYSRHLKRMTGGGAGGVYLEAKAAKGDPTPEDVAKKLRVQPVETKGEAEILEALENAEDDYEELDDDDLGVLLPGGVVDERTMLWGPKAHEDDDLPDLELFRAAGAAAFECQDLDGESCGEGEGEAGDRVARRAHAVDQLLAQEYREEEFGAIEDEDIEGNLDLDDVEAILDDFLDKKVEEQVKFRTVMDPQEGADDGVRVIEETKALIARFYTGEESEEETTASESEPDDSRQWDCESVLSTLSNTSNRPGRIGRIQVVKKPQAPKPATIREGREDDESSEDEAVVLPDVSTVRERGEATEDRRQRKAAVKELRRMCRKMKKESKETYKQEEAKLKKAGNGDLRDKVRYNRL